MNKVMMILFLMLFQHVTNAQFVFKVTNIKKVTKTKNDWTYSPIEIKNNMKIYLDDSTVLITGGEKEMLYVYGGESKDNESDGIKVKFWYAMDMYMNEVLFYLKTVSQKEIDFYFLDKTTGNGIHYNCEFSVSLFKETN
jgi:hypothetical protein